MSEAGEVKLHFLDYWRVIRVRWGIILLVFLLVMITACVTTYFMPKKYTSTVKIELKSDARTAKLMGSEPMAGGGMSPLFVSTQHEIIQSTSILNPVITQLKLDERWGGDTGKLPYEMTLRGLKDSLKVQQLRNTEMLEVSATTKVPEESAAIANAVAETYTQQKNQEDVSRTGSGLSEIKDRVDEALRRVEESQAEVNRLRDELAAEGIIDNSTDDEQMGLSDPGQSVLMTKEQEVNAIKTELSMARSRVEQVDKLDSDELLRSLINLKIEDQTVIQILPVFNTAASEKARLLNSGLGPRHPSVMAIQAQIDVFAKQLRDQSESIRQSLATAIRIQESALTTLETQLEDVRKRQASAKAKSAQYIAAKQRLRDLRLYYTNIFQDYQRQEAQRSVPLNPAKVWEPAVASAYPSSPKWLLNIALGVVIGLVVGVGLAFFIEYLDTSVKTMEDVENFLGVPVLAIIPKDIDLLHKVSGDTPDAEAYRILRTNIEFNRKSATANTISMVSGGPGEGKSTTLANMAYTFSQGGYSALIVDADLRRPTQHKLFGLGNDVGLTTYLTTDIKLDDAIFETGFENLRIMPSGILPTDAVGILNSQRMSDMISDLKSRYDMIFFDSPPILGVSDASVLASEVDLCILVVQHRRFPRSMLTRVKQSVVNVGGTILGVVLNNVDLKHDPNYQYYTSYYDYYAPQRDPEARPSKAKAAASARNNRDGDQY